MTRPDHTLFWLAAASFASMASMRICDPMLPVLASEFGVEPTGASGVVTMYTIGYGVAQIVHGPLGDRFGKARYIAGAAIAAALASLVCALAPGLALLELARLLTGSIAAAIIPLSMAWIGDTVAYGDRQATLAKYLNGTILGLILGQALGGLMADTVGWRAAFAMLTVIFAVSGWRLLATVRKAKLAVAPPAEPVMVPAKRAAGIANANGSSTAAAAMTNANAGARADCNAAISPAPTAIATATATVPTGTLQRYRFVLREPWARVILVVVALEGLLAFGALAFVPTWLHERGGLPVWLAGATVAAFGIGGFTYTVNAARLLRRFGEAGLSLGGGIVLALGFSLLTVAPGAVIGALACAMIGLGYHMLHNTLQTNATQMAPLVRGTAVALFAMSLFIGQSLGVSIVAESLDSTGFLAIFASAAAGLLVVGAVFGMLLRQRIPMAH